MRLLIFGEPNGEDALHALFEGSPLAFRKIECSFSPSYEEYLAALRDNPPDAVLVTAEGAAGMEGVKAAHSLAEDIPVIWFSEDKAFGAESYRLNCRYFGAKPITESQLASALERCQ